MCVQWEKENIRTGHRQLLHEGEGRRGVLRRSLAGVHLNRRNFHTLLHGIENDRSLKMKLRV